MTKEIYLDNAATTKCLPQSADIYRDALVNEYGNPSSMHMRGVKAEILLENSREKIAEGLKCKPKEIIFTSGGTESDLTSIFGAAKANKRYGMHVITSTIEHAAVAKPIQRLEGYDYDITYIPCDEKGMVRLDLLAGALQRDTVLVSIMHVNNETGVIQPIEEIGNIIQQKTDRCLFHVDAVQSVAKIPINLAKSNIDLLSASAHKFHGPKGVGFLYKKENILLEPFMPGGGQERGFRSGTVNVPGIAAMANSFSYVLGLNDEVTPRMYSLKEEFIENLLSLDGVHINGYYDRDKSAAHIVNVRFDDVTSEVLIHSLEEKGIYASAGSACSTHSKKKSGTLIAMGLAEHEAASSVRFSFSADTSSEDLEYTFEQIKELLPMLRKFKKR